MLFPHPGPLRLLGLPLGESLLDRTVLTGPCQAGTSVVTGWGGGQVECVGLCLSNSSHPKFLPRELCFMKDKIA